MIVVDLQQYCNTIYLAVKRKKKKCTSPIFQATHSGSFCVMLSKYLEGFLLSKTMKFVLIAPNYLSSESKNLDKLQYFRLQKGAHMTNYYTAKMRLPRFHFFSPQMNYQHMWQLKKKLKSWELLWQRTLFSKILLLQ